MKKLIIISLIFFLGCSSSKTIQSIPESEFVFGETSHLDEQDEILYQIFNDSALLHIQFSTAKRSSIMKILQSGFTIYFNNEGKKKKHISFEYPTPQDIELLRQNMQQQQQSERNSEINLKNMLDLVSANAVFSNHDVIQNINLLNNNSDIYAKLSSTRENELIYDLKIPLQKISEGGIADLSILTLGFISGKIEMPSTGGMQGGGPPGGGGGRSGGGGGGPPGGGGGKSGGGPPSGGMPGGSEMSAMSSPISFWVNAVLNNEK